MAFHRSFDIRIWIPINAFGFTVLLFITAATVIFFYQIRNNAHGQHLNKLHQLLSFCALISFSISILVDNLYITFVKLPANDDHVSVFEENLWTICNFFWALGYGATYGLFWSRMDRCFQSSSFRVSRRSTLLFSIMVSLYLLCMWAMSACWIPVTAGKWSWSTFTLYYDVLLWTRLVADFCINALIVYMFSSKLYRVILFSSVTQAMTCTGSTTSSEQEAASESDIVSPGNSSPNSQGSQATPKLTISSPIGEMKAENPEQVVQNMVAGANSALFNLLMKHFNLSMVTILSTQFFTISEIVISEGMYVADRTGDFDFYYASYIPYHILRSSDAVISTLYIILSFKFSSKYYQKLCGVQHRHCVGCWTKVIRNKMGADTSSTAHKV